jgi:hypothetical protein
LTTIVHASRQGLTVEHDSYALRAYSAPHGLVNKPNTPLGRLRLSVVTNLLALHSPGRKMTGVDVEARTNPKGHQPLGIRLNQELKTK